MQRNLFVKVQEGMEAAHKIASIARTATTKKEFPTSALRNLENKVEIMAGVFAFLVEASSLPSEPDDPDKFPEFAKISSQIDKIGRGVTISELVYASAIFREMGSYFRQRCITNLVMMGHRYDTGLKLIFPKTNKG